MDPWHEEETVRPGVFSRLHLGWPMLFLIGWVLYELTANPALGSVAVCIKFGWDDFCTAVWLWRRDPWRLRGRACLWIYQASGLWKIAIVAFLMSLAFVVISPKGGAGQAPRLAVLLDVVTWTGIATFVGLVSALVALSYSLVLSWWGGLRLWVSNDIHAARRRNDWPPPDGGHQRRNGVWPMVVAGMILFGIILIGFVILLDGLFLRGPLNRGIGGAAVILLPLLYLPSVVGDFYLILYLLRRIDPLLAQSPSECWGEQVETPLDAASLARPLRESVK